MIVDVYIFLFEAKKEDSKRCLKSSVRKSHASYEKKYF